MVQNDRIAERFVLDAPTQECTRKPVINVPVLQDTGGAHASQTDQGRAFSPVEEGPMRNQTRKQIVDMLVHQFVLQFLMETVGVTWDALQEWVS